jgi:hypothetical protein
VKECECEVNKSENQILVVKMILETLSGDKSQMLILKSYFSTATI